MTLSEICEAGTTAILIPSPNVTGNHQYLNARHLSEKGGAILIEEKNLSKEVVKNAIKDIKNDKNGRKKRAKILKELSTPNAAKDIINELELLKNGNK
jgi:UDP-N-acetylglucosamine--N-acetylmuramyl-(pentapeptide) pyrophosphoryl-undecaprenol N-acetylglucosamine transferase